MNRAGRVYFDNSTATLYYYAQGASASSSVVLEPDADGAFISYLTNLCYNRSFTINNGKLTIDPSVEGGATAVIGAWS